MSVKNISAADVKKLLALDDIILIDVREIIEFNSGYIQGAYNIPLSVFTDEIKTIDLSGDKKIVLQCRAGIRSDTACRILLEPGIDIKKDLYNFEGGISAWIELGYPIIR